MPESLIGSGEFFALIAKGKSMVDAGVYPDDYVIVRRQQTAENGDMVIALLDGKNNLKKLVKEDDGYILRSIIPYLRNCYELIYTSCLSGFPISSSESLSGLRSATFGAKRSSTGRAAPRYGYVFFLDLKKPSCAICIVNFVTAPKLCGKI